MKRKTEEPPSSFFFQCPENRQTKSQKRGYKADQKYIFISTKTVPGIVDPSGREYKELLSSNKNIKRFLYIRPEWYRRTAREQADKHEQKGGKKTKKNTTSHFLVSSTNYARVP